MIYAMTRANNTKSAPDASFRPVPMKCISVIGVMAKIVPKSDASASVPRPIPNTKMGESLNSCARSAKNIHISASKHM